MIENLPEGDYELFIEDQCGYTFTPQFSIVLPPVQLWADNHPGCQEGFGSVRVVPEGASFTSFVINEAPADFPGELPYEATMDEEDAFSMNGLPEGNYEVSYTIEGCTEPVESTVNVVGYHVTQSEFEVIGNCGSFDLFVKHVANAIPAGIWLQRYNEENGTWGHPTTGYSNNDYVNDANALELENMMVNYNLPYTGIFRILQAVYTYGQSNFYDLCYSVIHEFEFTGRPEINGAFAFPCTNGLAEVIIDAVGVAPLNYQITSKNGQDFVIDNGTLNVFMGLEKAVYNFKVTDGCGNLVNVLYDVSVLQPMEVLATEICEGQPASLYLPEYTFLTYEWYRPEQPDVVLSTDYKLDVAAYNSATDSGIYMVHIASVMPGSCIDTVVQFNAATSGFPDAGNDVAVAMCSQAEVINLDAYLSEGFTTGGTWQDVAATNALNGNLLNTALLSPGMYYFDYVVTQCDNQDSARITVEILSSNGTVLQLNGQCVDDVFVLGLTITHEMGQIQSVVWEGPSGFTHTGTETTIDITGLPEGTYYATVNMTDGCAAVSYIVVDNTKCGIPKGVSPNGDGLNDSFDLSHLDVQHLSVFNRYGFKVYEANDYKNEWYGQSDKGELTDGTYYYVVTFTTGKQKSGWVYLQRDAR